MIYNVYIYNSYTYIESKHMKRFILVLNTCGPTSAIFWPGGRKPRHCKFQVTNTCGCNGSHDIPP